MTFRVFLFISAGLLLLPVVVGECRNLRLYNDETEILDFTCDDHGGSESCRAGPDSFPGNLSKGESVNKPRDFQVNLFRQNFTIPGNAIIDASGMSYSWKVPLDSLSRKYTKGYYLKMQQVNSARVICRLFDLQGYDLSSPKMHFVYTMHPFSDKISVTFLIELFSLPPPSEEEYQEGLYGRYVATIPPYRNYSVDPVVYPDLWTTWINVVFFRSDGKVQVTFGLPEADSLAKFEIFYIQLVAEGENNHLYAVNYTKRAGEVAGRLNFTNVPTGTYKIRVTPKDRHSDSPTDCECWRIVKLNSYRVCGTCQITTTEFFSFTNTYVEPEQDTPPIPAASTAGENGKSHGLDAGIIAAVILSSFAFVGLLLVVGYFWRRKMLSKTTMGVDANKNNIKHNKNRMFQDIVIPDITAEDLKVPEFRRKTIFLLASEDHRSFNQALEKFAEFLELHCQCDVVLARRELPDLRKTSNSYCWLSRQIDSADFVVIVTSEAAYRLYLAFQKGFAYKDANFGPEGDLFTPGIQHICGKIASNEDVRKVVMVHFEHTPPSLRLPIAALPSRHYSLPNHLASFLHHLHNLDDNKMDLSKVNLPLKGNIEELTGGKEWLLAVITSRAFEEENQNWFAQKFGEDSEILSLHGDKPDYTKQVSGDSGYVDHNRLSSVSMQNLSASPTQLYPEGLGLDNRAYLENDMLAREPYSADRFTKVDLGDIAFTKHDFIEPSDIQSAYTVPYSTFTGGDRPAEIDASSTVSDQMRVLNEHYEQERRQEIHEGVDVCSTDKRSAISTQDPDQPTSPDFHGVHLERFQEDDDADCISVSSAQSV